MKQQYKNLKATLAVLVTGVATTSINADVEQGTATAFLVAPLSIAQNTPMDFGTVAGGPTAGTVELATNNVRNTTGDAQIIGNDGEAGVFTITGASGQTVNISFTNGQLVGPPGSAPMAVDTFTDDLTGGAGGGTVILPAASVTMLVGATLQVGADQQLGSYTTTGGTPYTVTVNYQ